MNLHKNNNIKNKKYTPANEGMTDARGTLSSCLADNIEVLERLLPLKKSFDLMTRTLYIGGTECFFIGVNGFCKTEVLQHIFSDLQNPDFMGGSEIENIQSFMDSKIGFAQTSLSSSWDEIIRNLLSGPCVLFVDGFSMAILLDARSYPARSISEPDSERITRGARDGFVETLLYNTSLIRRHVRSPRLTFEMHSVGTESRTDVAVAYLADSVNHELLEKLSQTIDSLQITSLTMGAKSLEEMLVKKRWWTPLPCIHMTERPDVAASYITEGHILIIVDNSPTVLILPCTIFQFTQSPEDYYKSPMVGGYFRFVRFLCIPISLLLMPAFLLITAYYPQLAQKWGIISTEGITSLHLIIYVLAVEFLLDLFKYSASVSSSRFSGSLSIVGGLLIGDIAVSLNWASVEVLFYAAVTLLTSLSLASVEFADALRLYRIFLIVLTAFWGKWGFIAGLTLVSCSIICTPTFGGMSYFWPLLPFNGKALAALLFRRVTSKAQPSVVWSRGHVHDK
ncbi:MAG: spore germination protein [Lachnospiraceae bacterium]|nr:spore germination protein [Lachnospiraceae bacterium]